MALAQNPRVLLLDGPFTGLSVEERRDVLRLIGSIPGDVTIVMIEHDMDVASIVLVEQNAKLVFGIFFQSRRVPRVGHSAGRPGGAPRRRVSRREESSHHCERSGWHR